MAVEAKRGCGYRKVGGMYLMAGGLSAPCCKMPLKLTVCPCCGNGIKQARGWTWIDAGKMFPAGGCVADPLTKLTCPAVNPALMGRVGLLWIGERFYPRPIDFQMEAAKLGVSRRMHKIPRGFKAGETWLLFAHPKAIQEHYQVTEVHVFGAGGYSTGTQGWQATNPDGTEIEGEVVFDTKEDALRRAATLDLSAPIFVPGVIYICKPSGFELIVKQSDYDRAVAAQTDSIPDVGEAEAELARSLGEKKTRDEARGIKWVPVPDDDPDHQGTVYDEGKEEEPATTE